MALKDRLTTILVTSPIVSHPSTELMDRVVASFDLVKDLCSCSLLILADGVKCGKFRPKKGVVTSEMVECYDTFLERLRVKISEASSDSIWSRTRMIKMTEHLGFGHVVYYGLRHCQTEYVLVVQHDHPFSVSFRLDPVIKLLDSGQAVYVSLPISTVWRHINRCSSLHKIDLRDKCIKLDGAKFIPILFWYDGTHIARRQSYIDLVFEGDIASPVGQFIEDNFSGQVMSRLKEDYDKWSRVYSMMVYQPFPEEAALIYHLDGRKYKTDEERLDLGWATNQGVGDIEKPSDK